MTYSKTGLDLTKGFESCRLSAYQDQGGVWTIGWGHTEGVKSGDVCTQEQADAWLAADIQRTADYVTRMVRVQLTQSEFDALVDFAFNVGTFALANSTLLRRLNARDFQGAAAEFDRWDHVKGTIVAGLLRRRQAESKEFSGPEEIQTGETS